MIRTFNSTRICWDPTAAGQLFASKPNTVLKTVNDLLESCIEKVPWLLKFIYYIESFNIYFIYYIESFNIYWHKILEHKSCLQLRKWVPFSFPVTFEAGSVGSSCVKHHNQPIFKTLLLHYNSRTT